MIQEWGTIEEIYAHLDCLSQELREKLETGKNDAFFSKELIKLMKVPELDNKPLEELELDIDFQQWEQILVQKWGFKSLQKTFDEIKKKLTQPQQLGLF